MTRKAARKRQQSGRSSADDRSLPRQAAQAAEGEAPASPTSLAAVASLSSCTVASSPLPAAVSASAAASLAVSSPQPQLAVTALSTALSTSPLGSPTKAAAASTAAIGDSLAVARPRRQATHKVDLLASDFFGPADAIKGLFALPYATADQTFALHKCGNTLLVDTLPNEAFEGLDEQTPAIAPEVNERTITTEGLLHNLADALSPAASATSANPAAGLEPTPFVAAPTGAPRAGADAEPDLEDPELDAGLPLSCPLTPPPAFYVPATPQPPSAILQWQFREMQLVLGSNLPVYRTDLHPALSVRAHDTTKQLQLHTCLDYYLDNVMANVPELALCMHAKGFIRGWKIVPTEDIPNLNRYARDGVSSAGSSSSNAPMFDPSVIDFNATMLLRFLKEHCQADEGTYLLRKTTQNETVHLYDLSGLSAARTKKWKWLLAMLSYRFAVRMAHHMDEVNASSRNHLLHRQRRLLNICLELLHQLTELGSETHETIEAAVLEHLANTHLVYQPTDDDQDEDANWSGSNAREPRMEELEAADAYLARAVSVIEAMVNKYRKRASTNDDDGADTTAGEEEKREEEGDDGDNEGGRRGDDDAGTQKQEQGQEQQEDYVEEMICMQLSGVVYKRMSVATRMIRFYLSRSQPQVGLQKLLRVVGSLRLWADVVRRTEQQAGSANLRSALADLTQHIWALLGELCRELFRLADTIDVCTTGDDLATLCIDTLVIQVLGHRKTCCPLDLLPSFLSGVAVTQVPHPLRRCGEQMCRSALQSKPIVTEDGQLAVTPELRLLLLRAFCESSLLSILPGENSEVSMPSSSAASSSVGIDGGSGGGAAREKMEFSVVRATHVRRLGDVCNELGKRFLARTTDARADRSVRCLTAATAGDWLQEALGCFNAVGDSVNAALVRCNISTLCRLYGTNTVPRPSVMTLRDSVRGGGGGGGSGSKARQAKEEARFEGEEYLTLALDVCFEAHEALETRELHPAAWDIVSQEAAMTYLAYGVAQRHACQGNVQPKDERRVIEPLQTALRIYERLNNHRKAAAAHFHMGSFYSKLWSNVGTEARATALLRQALQHYSQAYQYYSSQDVGPTLVLIVTDMFDLYMATGECLKVGGGSELAPPPLPEAHQPHVRTLQQAVSCILSIHNAFTPAVYQRYRKEIYKLARGVTKRVSKALLELLKCPVPSLLFLREPDSPELTANLADIKAAYKRLLTDLRDADTEQQQHHHHHHHQQLGEVDDQQAEAFVCRLGAFLAEIREQRWSEDIAKGLFS